MRKVLLIQSRRTPEKNQAEFDRFTRAFHRRAELVFESSVNTARDWQNPEDIVRGYDAVILGGSSDFFFDGGRHESDPERAQAKEILERLRPLVTYAIRESIPMLGVCLGHQILSEMHGGKVTHDHLQRKMGTYEVTLTDAGKNDPLFSTMPETFAAHYAHRDSVTSLPEGATLLAMGPVCKFSALRFGDTVYAVQFHPELIASDLLNNAEAIAEYLPEGVSIEEVVKESPATRHLLPSFLETFVGK
jgi:GMP synthase-like glutamine amidotransferase